MSIKLERKLDKKISGIVESIRICVWSDSGEYIRSVVNESVDRDVTILVWGPIHNLIWRDVRRYSMEYAAHIKV